MKATQKTEKNFKSLIKKAILKSDICELTSEVEELGTEVLTLTESPWINKIQVCSKIISMLDRIDCLVYYSELAEDHPLLLTWSGYFDKLTDLGNELQQCYLDDKLGY